MKERRKQREQGSTKRGKKKKEEEDQEGPGGVGLVLVLPRPAKNRPYGCVGNTHFSTTRTHEPCAWERRERTR